MDSESEYMDDAIVAISLVAGLLGISMLAGGELLALGPLCVCILGFAYLKLDSEQIDRWFTSREDTSTDPTEDALTVLRQRYARGEIDQTEFEQRLNDLLETETLEQAEEYHEETVIGERSQ